jgi:hypothetical protein
MGQEKRLRGLPELARARRGVSDELGRNFSS